MNDWPFLEGKKIIGLQMLELIDWVDRSWPASSDLLETDDKPLFALPPLQRDAVWRPKQVLDLWDSVMRGLPIGVLYLIWQPEGTVRKVIDKSGKTIEREQRGYDLLDGQQRIRALLLGAVGFSEEKRCLWVDLGDKDAVRGFGLHITSKGQPFGYDPKTGTRRSFDQRRDARAKLKQAGELICKGREAYDHELFDEVVTQGGNPLAPQPPLPYGHSKYVYKLPDLLSAWRKGSSDCSDETSDEEKDKYRFAALKATVGSGPTEKALIGLHEAFGRIQKVEVALLLVNPQSITDRENLLKLFDRIGAGGTPLSVEDRLYSIYKYHWPEVRDAVNGIHWQVGRVLSPTKIATTAIRIAYARSKEDGNSTPDVATFSKIVTDDKNFRNSLEQLIPSHRANNNATLRDSFKTIKALLSWNEGAGHYWIPDVMLASFPAELWQVLIFWAVLHPESVNSERSRQEAVRLALFWYLCVWKHEKAARWAFEQIRKIRDTTSFPGVDLYELLTGNREDRCAHQLIPTKEFEQRLCKEESCSWKTDEERFGSGISRNVFGSHWWWNGKKMLPWLQRDYIRRVFRGYMPLSDHEDDVPYDVDHMCAQKDWGENWQSLKHRLRVDNSLFEKIEQGRGAVGNGVGNLQLLESSDNRGWGDVDILIKMPFIQRDDQPPSPNDEKAMADFAFNPEDRKLWRRVSGSSEVSRQWNEDRLKAFQQAVEKRAVWLYQRFHDDLGFESWTKRESGTHWKSM